MEKPVISESIATARKLAPASLRSVWKLVTAPDYETSLAEHFPSVDSVTVLTCEECRNIPYLQVVVLVNLRHIRRDLDAVKFDEAVEGYDLHVGPPRNSRTGRSACA